MHCKKRAPTHSRHHRSSGCAQNLGANNSLPRASSAASGGNPCQRVDWIAALSFPDIDIRSQAMVGRSLRSNESVMSIHEFLASVTPNLKIREWCPARMLRPQHQLDRVAGGPLTVPFSEDQTSCLIARQCVFLRLYRVDLECPRQQLHHLRFSYQPEANQEPRPKSVTYGAQHPSCESLIDAHLARLTASARVQIHVAKESIRIFAARRTRLYDRTS